MSHNDFWIYNGSVQPLPSDDIREFVFNDLNKSLQSYCFAAVNRAYKEVWFFYVSNETIYTQPDKYVIYHTDQQCWSIGTLSRSAWTDSPLIGSPLAAALIIGANNAYTNQVYEQENGKDANGSALVASITTSMMDTSNGDVNTYVAGFTPDFQRMTGTMNLTVDTSYYPTDTNNTDGPFTVADDGSTGRVDLRSDGKLFGFSLTSDNSLGSDFRLGICRLDVQPTGARR